MAETFVTLQFVKDGAKQVFHAHQLMVYSLFYSIYRLYYEQDSKALAVLLICFSGILPYAKLLGMLVAWMLPLRLWSVRRRGQLLLFLDQIGKYSLVDVFVIQYISAAMHQSIPLGPGLVEGFADVDL